MLYSFLDVLFMGHILIYYIGYTVDKMKNLRLIMWTKENF